MLLWAWMITFWVLSGLVMVMIMEDLGFVMVLGSCVDWEWLVEVNLRGVERISYEGWEEAAWCWCCEWHYQHIIWRNTNDWWNLLGDIRGLKTRQLENGNTFLRNLIWRDSIVGRDKKYTLSYWISHKRRNAWDKNLFCDWNIVETKDN